MPVFSGHSGGEYLDLLHCIHAGLDHAIDLIHFEKLPYALTEEVLDHAFESCFVQDAEDDDAGYTPVVTMPRPKPAYA